MRRSTIYIFKMYLFIVIMLLEHNKNFSFNKENRKKINKFGGGVYILLCSKHHQEAQC